VQIEEPTGIYRRYDEVAVAPLAKFGGHREGFRIRDSRGNEQPWQVSGDELLFPASAIPRSPPVYHVTCCENTSAFTNQIVLRRVGMRRVELGNSRSHVEETIICSSST